MIHRVKINSDGSTDTRELIVSLGDVVEIWADNAVITHLYVEGGQGVCVDCPLHKSFQTNRCPNNRGYPICCGYINGSRDFIKFREISLEEL